MFFGILHFDNVLKKQEQLRHFDNYNENSHNTVYGLLTKIFMRQRPWGVMGYILSTIQALGLTSLQERGEKGFNICLISLQMRII